MIVTEYSEHCVSIFSSDGKKLRSFGTRGSDKGQFKYPSGVAVDSEGNILVADRDNIRIQKFTSSGQFLKVTRGVPFSCPDGIAFNSSNNKIYVIDVHNHRVQVLNSDLTYSSTIGRPGSGNGEFYHPCGISCDSTGKVYVADCHNNHRIQVFTAEGTFITKFAKHGENEGNLNRPTGIAIDTSGFIYVSEEGNGRISVFTSEGQFISTFGGCGFGGEFINPEGLAVNKDGILYVCDYDNNRVQCFK